jgi:hypothetical protein
MVGSWYPRRRQTRKDGLNEMARIVTSGYHADYIDNELGRDGLMLYQPLLGIIPLAIAILLIIIIIVAGRDKGRR